MDSEGKRSGFMSAIGQFEREMDALMHPVTRDALMESTKRLLIGMFEYSAKQAATRTNILAKNNDIPTEYELENFSDSLPEILKLGLFDQLAEEYIILFGKEKFDKWIGPFTRSVLRGHVEESVSLEHLNECPERFCSAEIIKCFINDRLRSQRSIIHENEEYLAFPGEIVHMNVAIVRELRSLGVYGGIEAENLLDDYRWWLEAIEDGAVNFDRKVFEV